MYFAWNTGEFTTSMENIYKFQTYNDDSVFSFLGQIKFENSALPAAAATKENNCQGL